MICRAAPSGRRLMCRAGLSGRRRLSLGTRLRLAPLKTVDVCVPHILTSTALAPPVVPSAASQSRGWARRDIFTSRSPTLTKDEMERKMRRFELMLLDPTSAAIRRKDAKSWFGFSSEDLHLLEDKVVLKQSPYETSAAVGAVRHYAADDLVELMLQRREQDPKKWSHDQILYNYKNYLEHPTGERARLREKLYGGGSGEAKARLYGTQALRTALRKQSAGALEGRESVQQGLISNVAICLVKGSVWIVTGSHAIFADLMHSTADVSNYAYRLYTLPQTSKQRDFTHPYGYATLRFIAADRSFVILGGLGCVVPIITVGGELWHFATDSIAASVAVAPESHLLAAAMIFIVSMALEGIAVRTAMHEILDAAPHGDFWGTTPAERLRRYMREGADIMTVATFTEAGSGVVGSAVGIVGIGLSYYFESGMWDMGASLIMATAVGGAAKFLLGRSGDLLMHSTLPAQRVERLVDKLEALPAIVALYDVKTQVIGTDTVRFKAEVQFNPEAITAELMDRRALGFVSEPGQASKPPGARSGSLDRPRISATPGWGRHPGCNKELLATQRIVEQQFKHQRMLSNTMAQLRRQLTKQVRQLNGGLDSPEAIEDWLYDTTTIFYEALAWQTKRAEEVLLEELRDYRHVHIDLEPW